VRFLPRHASEYYDLLLERPRLLALCRELARGADLAHLHHWSTLSSGVARALARELPVAITLHDSFATCPRFFRVPVAPVERCPDPGDVEPCVLCVEPQAGGLPRTTLRAMLTARASSFRAELEAAARVVAPSRAHAARLARLTGLAPARVAVVRHGLSRPLSPAPAPPAWDGTGTLRVLHLGHRATVKGTADLVAALAALVPQRRARVELHLLGAEVEEGLDARLRAAADGLALRFHGDYRLETLGQRLAELGGAHLAALPSRVEESYGLVVDEALALGLPVWVSDRGAPKERVGAAGRVLPAADAAAWTRAFDGLFDDPGRLAAERAAVPAHGRTAADAARELEALYRSVLVPAEKGSSPGSST